MLPSLPRRWSNANSTNKSFPLPVGRLTKTSFPCKNFFEACNCCLEDHGFLIYGQHAILTPLSGLHPTSQMQMRLSISYRIPSTLRKLRTLLNKTSVVKKSGTLEQKCSTIFPDPPVVVVNDKHLRHGGSAYETRCGRGWGEAGGGSAPGRCGRGAPLPPS